MDALENSDIDRLVALLTEDARLTMPPEPLEYQGHTAIAGFYPRLPWWGGRALRLVPTRERPARVRLLPPRPPQPDRARLRAAGAHPGGRPDLRPHPYRRQQPPPAVRAAPDAPRPGHAVQVADRHVCLGGRRQELVRTTSRWVARVIAT
ncbi:hypothetical protein [Streptomyces sp. NPDC001165]|uniref:hypothetical protein n=1 Tax=Streptomyces sp. NPDC001165 TaxID=3364546 RepID=UPI00367E943E